MTTADSDACVFYFLDTKILCTGNNSITFVSDHSHIADKIDVYYFTFPTEKDTSEIKLGADTIV